MSQISELPEEELRLRAHAWRRAALRGEIDARGHAHEHEVELRRRVGIATTMSAPLDDETQRRRRRPFWRFW